MRDPARTPREAQNRYVGYLQQSLSCITNAIWLPGPPMEHDDNIRALVLSEDPLALRRENAEAVFLGASQLFELVPSDRYDGEYRTKTHGYIYSVALDSPDEPHEFMAWHWHPLSTPGRRFPHLHVSADQMLLGASLKRLHVPTGRVAIEEVVRFLIDELGVIATRDDWRDITQDTFSRFREFRSWA